MKTVLHISADSLTNFPARYAHKRATQAARKLDAEIKVLLRSGRTLDQLELVHYPYPECRTEVRVKHEFADARR